MKVSYDSRTDIVTVVLRDGVPGAESDEDKPGVILAQALVAALRAGTT